LVADLGLGKRERQRHTLVQSLTDKSGEKKKKQLRKREGDATSRVRKTGTSHALVDRFKKDQQQVRSTETQGKGVPTSALGREQRTQEPTRHNATTSGC